MYLAGKRLSRLDKGFDGKKIMETFEEEWAGYSSKCTAWLFWGRRFWRSPGRNGNRSLMMRRGSRNDGVSLSGSQLEPPTPHCRCVRESPMRNLSVPSGTSGDVATPPMSPISTGRPGHLQVL